MRRQNPIGRTCDTIFHGFTTSWKCIRLFAGRSVVVWLNYSDWIITVFTCWTPPVLHCPSNKVIGAITVPHGLTTPAARGWEVFSCKCKWKGCLLHKEMEHVRVREGHWTGLRLTDLLCILLAPALILVSDGIQLLGFGGVQTPNIVFYQPQ